MILNIKCFLKVRFNIQIFSWWRGNRKGQDTFFIFAVEMLFMWICCLFYSMATVLLCLSLQCVWFTQLIVVDKTVVTNQTNRHLCLELTNQLSVLQPHYAASLLRLCLSSMETNPFHIQFQQKLIKCVLKQYWLV